MKDIFDDIEFKEYAEHFMLEVAPKIKDSAYLMTIAPDGGHADVKIAVEIGYAILLNKPLIVVKMPGRTIAEKLLRIADHVIEGDLTTEEGRDSIFQQFARIVAQ